MRHLGAVGARLVRLAGCTVRVDQRFVREEVLHGIGLLGYEAIVERDYPTVMGILAITSMLMLVGNIVSDICVALVDPRVRFGE